jgi:hypothetical protein
MANINHQEQYYDYNSSMPYSIDKRGLPVLVPGTPNASVLFIDDKIDVSQSLWYTNAAIDARVSGTNHNNSQTPRVFHWRVIEFERRFCTDTVCIVVYMKTRRVGRKIRYRRHGQEKRIRCTIRVVAQFVSKLWSIQRLQWPA